MGSQHAVLPDVQVPGLGLKFIMFNHYDACLSVSTVNYKMAYKLFFLRNHFYAYEEEEKKDFFSLSGSCYLLLSFSYNPIFSYGYVIHAL